MNKFIVIETFDPNFPVIVTEEDGIPKIFDSFGAAWVEKEDCQEGQIVEIF